MNPQKKNLPSEGELFAAVNGKMKIGSKRAELGASVSFSRRWKGYYLPVVPSVGRIAKWTPLSSWSMTSQRRGNETSVMLI